MHQPSTTTWNYEPHIRRQRLWLTVYCSCRDLSVPSLVEADKVPTIWKAGPPRREADVSSASSWELSPVARVDKNYWHWQYTSGQWTHARLYSRRTYIRDGLATCLATWAMCLEEYLSTSLIKIRLGRVCRFLSSIFKWGGFPVTKWTFLAITNFHVKMSVKALTGSLRVW